MLEGAVPFLDLRRRVEALRPRLEAEVGRVFERGRFILGDSGTEIEREVAKYCGVAHGVAVASGTDALWLALEALGVGPGDEVVTVSNTCAPTIAAVLKAGAIPVLVDVDPQTLTMDPARTEAALTPRSKCLLPVHLYGQCADLGALRDLSERRGLVLLEDCAQAHGAEHGGRRAGSVGHAGSFSFYPTKNLWALGDGGMVVTDDAALAHRLRLLRNYGYSGPNQSVLKGYNSRLDEVQAAVLLAGLSRLDGWNDRRRDIAARYTAAFQGGAITPPMEAAEARHVYHLYVVRSSERQRVREALHQRGIETMIHYPMPVHRQEGYAGLVRIGPGGLGTTERLAAEVFSLPLYPELTDHEVDRVIEAVTAACGSHGEARPGS
jgi:dTDP-4-amino-4,6-dideoxygalactose transaminase